MKEHNKTKGIPMPLFQKGQSGNLKGRPKKKISTILSEHVTENDAQILAEMLLKFTINGEVTLKNGQTITAESVKEWFEAVKWIYEHIDGKHPEKIENEITITIERENEPENHPTHALPTAKGDSEPYRPL